MSFRLKEAVFKVRCREPGCPFLAEFSVKENLMGVTESDIDSEALKIAKNLAAIRHDAIYGRKHQLANPEINKISGTFERIGGLTAIPSPSPAGAADHDRPRLFNRGDVIVRKREEEAAACEVLRGSAFNAGLPEFRYKAGAIFGTAALFNQRSRPADIIAAEDGTAVAFHNVRDLTKSNPGKARELYDHALEEVFTILVRFGDYSASLEKKLQKLESKKGARKPARKPAAKPLARTRPKARRKPASLKAKPAQARKR